MAVQFDITPEKEASTSQYLYRQLFLKAPVVTKRDADLQGQTAIITGSNVGLGLETARQLLDLGLSRLILAVRSASKGEAARKDLSSGRTPGSFEIEVWSLDLGSYQSITEFVERAKGLDRLDIAVLNAGIFKVKEEFNPSTGFEEDIQINYLSTALLALLLLPPLKKISRTHPGRLVIVSSDMAGWTQFKERSSKTILCSFKEKSEKWNYQDRYGTSKLLGQLFLTELARRVPASLITMDAVNPGFTYGSDFQREGQGTFLGFLFRCYTRLLGKSCSTNARSIVHAAVSFGEKVHGQYVEDGRIRPKAPIIYKPQGEQLAKRLWEETMTEFSFAGVQEVVSSIN